jgi:hypothetical protein
VDADGRRAGSSNAGNHPGELSVNSHIHPFFGERGAMPSDAPLRYRIVLRGESGHLLRDILGDATIESQRGWTCVIATVADEPGFYRLLDRFQDLALPVVSINQLSPLAADLPPASW